MRKKKKLKKAFLYIAAVILLVFLYLVGSVYLWGVYVAEKELSKYATEVLGLQEEIICKYDWYNDRYIATNLLNFTLDYRRDTHTIHDESFSLSESSKVNNDYIALIQNMPDYLTFPPNITIWTEINADDYTIKSQRLYLLGVFNTENLSEAESLERPANIAMKVIEQLGENYNYTGIQVVYYDKNGCFEISFPADSFVPITVEKLLKHTKQVEIGKHSEQYDRWLDENSFR